MMTSITGFNENISFELNGELNHMSFTDLQESVAPGSSESNAHAFPTSSPPPPLLASFPIASTNSGSNTVLPIDLGVGSDSQLYSLRRQKTNRRWPGHSIFEPRKP